MKPIAKAESLPSIEPWLENLARERIQHWSMVQAMLAAYWQIEDESDGAEWLRRAEALL